MKGTKQRVRYGILGALIALGFLIVVARGSVRSWFSSSNPQHSGLAARSLKPDEVITTGQPVSNPGFSEEEFTEQNLKRLEYSFVSEAERRRQQVLDFVLEEGGNAGDRIAFAHSVTSKVTTLSGKVLGLTEISLRPTGLSFESGGFEKPLPANISTESFHFIIVTSFVEGYLQSVVCNRQDGKPLSLDNEGCSKAIQRHLEIKKW